MKYWSLLNNTGTELLKLKLKREDLEVTTIASIYKSGYIYIGCKDKETNKSVSNVGLRLEELVELQQIAKETLGY